MAFETHKADMDPAPFFRGLPDDRCQCPHWGVVLSGRIIFRYPDHDEVYTAGDAYYGAPGHLPLLFAGTELVEFSPTGPLNETWRSSARTSRRAGPDMDDVTRALSEKLVAFLETGTVRGTVPPGRLPRPDHADLAGPGRGDRDLIAERKQGHPGPAG